MNYRTRDFARRAAELVNEQVGEQAREAFDKIESLINENHYLRIELFFLRRMLNRRKGQMEYCDIHFEDESVDVYVEEYNGVSIDWYSDEDGNESHSLVIEDYFGKGEGPVQLIYTGIGINDDGDAVIDTRYFDSIEAALVYAHMIYGLPQ